MIRNLKKLLAFTIVFAMLVSTVAFASPYPDVADDASYAEAVTTLSSLGLLMGDDQGNFNPDNTITRAEFAAVIVRTLGLGDPGTTATDFIDVPATHWGSGYVQMASQMGVIAGYGDGNFGPEDPVTFEQAIKMIVAALGYTPKANALGGYPTGYMVVAAQEGISAGINATAGEPALRKVVAELVYNALDVPLMVQTGWGTDITYEQQDGQGNRPYATILTQKLDVDKVEGIVTDNNAVKNVGRRPADKTVTITYDKVNGFATSYYYNTNRNAEVVQPYIGDTNAADLLGQTVVAYIRDLDESDATIIAIAPKTGRNEFFTVDIDDIVEINTNRYYIEYEEEDRDFEQLDLEEDVVVIYNEVYSNSYDLDELAQNYDNGEYSGVIELLDNDNDGYYEYIFVKNYQNAVVDRVEPARHRIEYKSDFTVGRIQNQFDPDDKIEFVFILDGEEIELADLQEWDVLSIMADNPVLRNAQIYKIYVTREVVEGVINETDDDEYYISGTPYKLAGNLAEDAVRLEDEGSFYLDMQGKIAALDATSATLENYAILLEAARGTWDDYEVKILTSEGREVVLNTANRVRLNGSTKEPEEVLEWFEQRGYLKAREGYEGVYEHGKPAIVTYNTNSSGYLNRIDFVAYADPDGNISDQDAYVAKNRTYDDRESSLRSFYLDEGTVVFDVRPTKEEDGEYVYDYKKYVVGSRNFFVDDEVYTAIGYEVDRDDVAKIVFVTSGGDTRNIGANVAVVDRVTQTRNDDGDSVYRLYLLVHGEEVSYLTSADDYEGDNLNDVRRGHVISFDLDARGEISKVVTLLDVPYNSSHDDSRIAANASIYDNVAQGLGDDKIEIIYGRVAGRTTNGVRLLSTNNYDYEILYHGPEGVGLENYPYDEDYNFTLRSAEIYEYDILRDRVFIEGSSIITTYIEGEATDGTEDDGSYVFLYLVDGTPEVAVVFTVQN